MPRLIFKCPYIKGGTSAACSHLENYVQYMATRSGVDRIDPGRNGWPATINQKEMIEQILRDFPLSRGMFEYEDYRATPTRSNASEFITRALEDNYDRIAKMDNYLNYIATRPRAQRIGSHGLFTGEEDSLVLAQIAEAVSTHPGNVWLPIISLRREDAARLGYDKADEWKALLSKYAMEMARAMKIPWADFRWYAAFHDEGHHPHVHMVCYSVDPSKGFLTKQGITQIKSGLAKEIFRQELTELYQKQTQRRNELNVDAQTVLNEVINQMQSGTVQNKHIEELLQYLADRLRFLSGKKQYGYLKAEEVTFTVKDTAEIQKVEMKDDVPTGTLIINKKGEFLEDVTLADTIGGWISHIFEYITGALKDVTFEVYALEDIQAADGESEDYYKKDELIATITTDETGIAKLSGLPLGRYYVKEKETAEGYVLDGEIREIDLTYVDQDTAEVTWSGDWQNNRQKVEVSVLKKEKDTDRVLAGAVFALSAKEDITNKDGDVILEAGTVIEEKATGEDGTLLFEADLPIGFSYTVKETSPAPGFAATDEVQEFTFTAESSDKATVSYEFTFEDEPTVFEFTKTSLTDGKEVEGAKLTVTDENGEVVDEWVSGKEPHIIKELVAGQTYTMTEILPAPGYVTAESIQFTVEDTAEVQKVEMKDNVTKVEISKTDIAGEELPGAKLTILDENGEVVESWTSTAEPHYIEMLPIGKYTLHEESAPEGYLVAEDVEFEVKDTGEIQKVVMKDEAEPEDTPETPQDTTSVDAPQTGDHSNILLWSALLGLGLCGSVVAVILRRKRK